MAQSLDNLYKCTVLRLKALYIDEEARAMADRIMQHFLNLTPIQRVTNGTSSADENKIPSIENAIIKLLNHVPLQYVLGKAYFLDLEFDVTSSVLIPRPETEEMLSLILKYYQSDTLVKNLRILDIGTGSGCIAISLKKHIPHSLVSAVDISNEAIAVAKRNAEKNEVQVTFVKADILDSSQWQMLPESNLIVSNPPYVTDSEKVMMQPNVLKYEPHTALFVADDDPLVFYRSIMMFSKTKLVPGGTLWLEINEAFGPDVVSLFENDIFKDRILLKDMFGKYRFVKVTK